MRILLVVLVSSLCIADEPRIGFDRHRSEGGESRQLELGGVKADHEGRYRAFFQGEYEPITSRYEKAYDITDWYNIWYRGRLVENGKMSEQGVSQREYQHNGDPKQIRQI